MGFEVFAGKEKVTPVVRGESAANGTGFAIFVKPPKKQEVTETAPAGMGDLRAVDVVSPPSGMGALRANDIVEPESNIGLSLQKGIIDRADKMYGGFTPPAGTEPNPWQLPDDSVYTDEKVRNHRPQGMVENVAYGAGGMVSDLPLFVTGQAAIGNPVTTSLIPRVGNLAARTLGAGATGAALGGVEAAVEGQPLPEALGTMGTSAAMWGGAEVGLGALGAAVKALRGKPGLPKVEGLDLTRPAPEPPPPPPTRLPFKTAMPEYAINNAQSFERGRDFSGRTEWEYPQSYVDAPARSGGDVATIPVQGPRAVRSAAENLSPEVTEPVRTSPTGAFATKTPSFQGGPQDYAIDNLTGFSRGKDFVSKPDYAFPQGYTDALPRSGGKAETVIPGPDLRTVRSGASIETPAVWEPKKITEPIENRTFEEVGDKKVKAYQYEHPELKPYIQTEANRLLNELADTVKGQRTAVQTEEGTLFSGSKRFASDPIAKILDETGATYKEVVQAFDNIIADKGRENSALAKRIELIIDDNLSKGTKSLEGMDLPPDMAYVKAKNKIAGVISRSESAVSEKDIEAILPSKKEPSAIPTEVTTEPIVAAKETPNVNVSTEATQASRETVIAQKPIVSGDKSAGMSKANTSLADHGLSLTSGKTANGNSVWELSGNTEGYKNILQKLGGREQKSKGTWSFYGDKDPTEKIMSRLSSLEGEKGASKIPQGLEMGNAVIGPGGKRLTVIDSSDPSMLLVRNEKGSEFKIGRKAVKPLPPEEIQAMPAGAAASVPQKTTSSAVMDTVKRRDIVKFLDEKLNVPIRVGRYNIKNALGIFKVKPEVIRSRIANDLPTISHEVGHKLDKQLKLADPAHDPELMGLGRVTSLPSYTTDQVRKEGVAEFMRLYLTNEQAAKNLAPKYYAAFEKQMASHPEIHDILLRARQDIFTWYNQPAKARVLGVLSTSQKSQRKMSLDRLYSLTIDEIDPIKNFVDEVGAKGLPIEKDPYKLAWLARGWTGKAEVLIHQGVLDANGKKIGKSLDEILKPIEKELDDFRAYAMAKHSLEVTAQGKNTGILDADAMEVIKSSPAKYQQAMDDLVKYQDATLNQLVEAGVMDASAVKKMRQMYPNYIPFQRVFDESPGAVTEWLSRGGFANLNNPVKTLKGSDREIIDPLESIIKNTYTFTNIAERNKVGRAIAELTELKEGLGRLVEKVDGSQSGKENVLKVYRSGKPGHYQLQPDLYRATLALDRESANVLVKMLQYPASWLRAGATLSPDFMVRNPIRDMFSAFINSRYGFTPIIDTMRGLFHAVKKDDLYWQWMNSGGAHSMMVSMDRDYLQKSLRDMLKKSPRDKAIAVVNPKTYLEMLRALSEIGEQATRLGEFGKGIRSGANPLEAALASRDVTLDFSRMGSKGKAWNKAVAFLNAQVQGMDKTVRQIKANPVGSTMKILTSITLPSVLLYLNNRNDPRYQELPRWQKDLFWIVPTKEHLFKIPKPFELGILFGSVPERILEYIDTQDRKSFDEMGKTIWSAGAPNVIPTAFLPMIEAYANYSFFTDRAIVPQREQKLEPKMQYGPYTTESAKAVGDLTDISPRKIEHVFRGYTGGLGMYVTKGAEAIADAAGAMDRTPSPAWTVEDVPGIKAVMTKPFQSSQSVKEFYDELSTLEGQYQAMKQTKSGPPEGFRMGRLAMLRKADERLQDLRKRERMIEASESMTPEIKRNELDRLNMIMLNTVRAIQGKEKVAK